MVEVFKTNVKERHHANMLIDHIHRIFNDYKVNFDLDDCDHILRVKSSSGIIIQASFFVELLERLGFDAELLPDTPSVSRLVLHN